MFLRLRVAKSLSFSALHPGWSNLNALPAPMHCLHTQDITSLIARTTPREAPTANIILKVTDSLSLRLGRVMRLSGAGSMQSLSLANPCSVPLRLPLDARAAADRARQRVSHCIFLLSFHVLRAQDGKPIVQFGGFGALFQGEARAFRFPWAPCLFDVCFA